MNFDTVWEPVESDYLQRQLWSKSKKPGAQKLSEVARYSHTHIYLPQSPDQILLFCFPHYFRHVTLFLNIRDWFCMWTVLGFIDGVKYQVTSAIDTCNVRWEGSFSYYFFYNHGQNDDLGFVIIHCIKQADDLYSFLFLCTTTVLQWKSSPSFNSGIRAIWFQKIPLGSLVCLHVINDIDEPSDYLIRWTIKWYLASGILISLRSLSYLRWRYKDHASREQAKLVGEFGIFECP